MKKEESYLAPEEIKMQASATVGIDHSGAANVFIPTHDGGGGIIPEWKRPMKNPIDETLPLMKLRNGDGSALHAAGSSNFTLDPGKHSGHGGSASTFPAYRPVTQADLNYQAPARSYEYLPRAHRHGGPSGPISATGESESQPLIETYPAYGHDPESNPVYTMNPPQHLVYEGPPQHSGYVGAGAPHAGYVKYSLGPQGYVAPLHGNYFAPSQYPGNAAPPYGGYVVAPPQNPVYVYMTQPVDNPPMQPRVSKWKRFGEALLSVATSFGVALCGGIAADAVPDDAAGDGG